MVASPRQMGPSWVANRETDQWNKIADERIFAMSSSCDKAEFNPPTKGLTDALPTALMHLAELHNQLSEENVQAAVTRFESFIKNLKTSYPSFAEFRNSEAFGEFDDEQFDLDQLNSTPLNDEIGVGQYTQEELESAKRARYF